MIRERALKNRKAAVKPIAVGKHLIVDPDVCHGDLTFRGTRVPVRTVLLCLARGRSMAYLRKSWPEVSPQAIEEAASLAADLLVHRFRNSKP